MDEALQERIVGAITLDASISRPRAIRELNRTVDVLYGGPPNIAKTALSPCLPYLRYQPRVEDWRLSPVIFSHGNWTTYDKMVIMTPSG